MKKFLAIALAALMVFALVACTGDKEPAGPAATTYEGTPADLVAKIYEIQPVELALMDPTAIDLADADAVKAYLGLEDASNIKEAVFSETMIGSQAYSLVVARVNDTAKIEETKQAIIDGINPAKWICVEADQVRVAAAADMIILSMVNSDLAADLNADSADLADCLVEAFKTTVGELTGDILKK